MRILIGGTPRGTLKHITVEQYREHCGVLTSWRDGTRPMNALKLGAPWAQDNYAFTGFDEQKWVRYLKRDEGVPGCLFSAAPDVVGEARATLRLFAKWGDFIRRHGYPVALVIQNWLTVDQVPWGDVDAIFVGGDDRYKFSPDADAIVAEANRRGLWTHNGRINSAKRWTYALHQGVKSVDGSGLAVQRRRILEALSVLQHHNQYLFT